AARTPGGPPPPPLPRVAYSAFVDPSGGSMDSMTLAIAHAELDGDKVVALLDEVEEVRPPFSPEQVVERFVATLRRYRVDHAVGDRYAAEWSAEAFRKHGVEYVASEKPKSAIYLEALPMFTSSRVRLLDLPRLLAQLLGLERRTARGGKDTVDHPPGGRDDVSNAACGALLSAASSIDAGFDVLAGNVRAERAVRVLERDGRNELAWMRRI